MFNFSVFLLELSHLPLLLSPCLFLLNKLLKYSKLRLLQNLTQIQWCNDAHLHPNVCCKHASHTFCIMVHVLDLNTYTHPLNIYTHPLQTPTLWQALGDRHFPILAQYLRFPSCEHFKQYFSNNGMPQLSIHLQWDIKTSACAEVHNFC